MPAMMDLLSPGGLDTTVRDWLAAYQEEVVFQRMSWAGRRMLKNPLDLYVYDELIRETMVDVVVELGTHDGGSAAWFADRCQMVVTVDRQPPPRPEELAGVHVVTGDVLRGDTVNRVRDVLRTFPSLQDPRVMVVADSDHRAVHVRQELVYWGPLVTPGCYYVVEDTVMDVMGWAPEGGGPLVGLQQYLAELLEEDAGGFLAWQVDRGREKFGLTYNPGGYLRRVR